eukprot:4130123-Prymnesium_polylepis.1
MDMTMSMMMNAFDTPGTARASATIILLSSFTLRARRVRRAHGVRRRGARVRVVCLGMSGLDAWREWGQGGERAHGMWWGGGAPLEQPEDAERAQASKH